MFASADEAGDTISDLRVSDASEDQFVFTASLFENFTGDDAFDLIGPGYMRAVANSGTTKVQIDVDGGGTLSNGVLADHLIFQHDLIA